MLQYIVSTHCGIPIFKPPARSIARISISDLETKKLKEFALYYSRGIYGVLVCQPCTYMHIEFHLYSIDKKRGKELYQVQRTKCETKSISIQTYRGG